MQRRHWRLRWAKMGKSWVRSGFAPAHPFERLRARSTVACEGDPSLRLKNGSAQDDPDSLFLLLQLPPHVFEIVKALFAGEPFGGADGAFGEAAARFGVVAEVDAVGWGFEDDFVQADDLAFAERSDLDAFRLLSGVAEDVLEGDRGARRGVFLVDVV